MATADELYLLFQQCSDLQKEKIADWEKHFSWLEEIVSLSNEARGQSVLPKTPMTTRKIKKAKVELSEKEENEEAFCTFSVPSNPGLRKSSRAAAKTATKKIGRTLEDISNISSKLRRPSSPKKVTFTPPKDQPKVPCQPIIVEDVNKSNRCSDIEEVSESEPEPLCSKEVETGELLSQRKSTAQSWSSDSGIGTEKHEVDFKCDNAKRQSLEKLNVEENVAVQQAAIVTEIIENDLEHDKIMMPPPNWRGPSEVMSKLDTDTNKNTKAADQLEEEIKKPVRLTRTKKRLVEEKDVEEQQQPVRVTRTKKRKMEEEVENSSTILKDKPIVVFNDCVSDSHQVTETSKRVTRSKVKQINNTNSPIHVAQSNGTAPKLNKYGVSSPRSGNQIKSSKPGTQTNSPLLTSFPNNRKHVPCIRITEVEEVSVSDTDVLQSPVKVVKHTAIFDKHSTSLKAPLSSQQYQTPTQSSLYKARIHGLQYSKNNHLHSNTSVLSSGSLHSVLSQKRTFISSSSPNISSIRIIGTPTEVNKSKNLISGVNSFITKVQPPKPTKEESEERKLEELRRKNERVEETKRKKDEFLKHKVEEQKRKNEERMRRVQEAREARDKKALEARQLQEQERKLKEERLKEEKKKLISAKKKDELGKIQRIKEQEDKQRQIEEQRRIDEKHKDEQRRAEEKQKEELKKAELRQKEEQKRTEEKVKEEQKKAEEKHKEERNKAEEELLMAIERKKVELQQKEELRMTEEKRQEELKRTEEKRQKLEEQKRLLEQKREKEQRAKEEYERHKMKERERIEREKRELQALREKDEAAKRENPNSTFTLETKEIANATYIKPSETSNADSYEITPVTKKPIKKKSSNPDDYNIRDICSDDSTDEEGAPKKQIPLWAKGDFLRKTLFSQEYYPPDIDVIFPPHHLLTMPDLSTIFTVKNREQKIKYSKRTSSAVWDTPPYKLGGQG